MQTRPLPFWLMIVSIAMAVLPVWRSPMISSRWPRPIGISASIALIPVWTGVSTDWRTMTPGAIRSTGRVLVDSIGPLSSSGRPSGSTTRPRSASPTGTSTTRPVVLTVSPSLIARVVAEDDRTDRLLLEVQGHADDAVGELEHLGRQRAVEAVDLGDAVTDLDDGADAARLGARSNVSIADLMMLMISSERMAMSVLLEGARHELIAESLEATSHTAVDEAVAHPNDEAAEQARIDRTSSSTLPPVDCSIRAGTARISSAASGTALATVAATMPRCR